MISALWLLASSLGTYHSHAPLVERQAWLQPFFSPRPGEPLSVSDRAVAVEKRDPLLVKGELWIKPPPGICFTVQIHRDKLDRRVCKPTPLSWEVFDLDSAGRLHIKIAVEDDTEGIHLSWPSPYRVANYVPLGAMASQENYNIPIHRCVASDDGTQRKITLHTMDSRLWYILLPDFDSPLMEAGEIPNLNVKSDKPAEPAPAVADQASGSAAPDTARKPAKSVLGQLLSGEYKKIEKEAFHFKVGKRNAYEMSSSGFMVTAVPQGMQGRCRYQFTDAPGDPNSGVIECYDTDTFDTIYTHVTCFSKFKARLNPRAKKKPVAQP